MRGFKGRKLDSVSLLSGSSVLRDCQHLLVYQDIRSNSMEQCVQSPDERLLDEHGTAKPSCSRVVEPQTPWQ